jgi:hypothetical protein
MNGMISSEKSLPKRVVKKGSCQFRARLTPTIHAAVRPIGWQAVALDRTVNDFMITARAGDGCLSIEYVAQTGSIGSLRVAAWRHSKPQRSSVRWIGSVV